MFTAYTYQDWLAAKEADRPKLISDIIQAYKASDEFKSALVAYDYFNAANREISSKVILRPKTFTQTDEKGKKKNFAMQQEVVGNRIYSNFFFRFVVQQNQYLLANGVTLKDVASKEKLGIGFDKTLEQIGEKALICGLCWGFWNLDHLEIIPAVTDALSGFVALLDERTAAPMLGIRFWQLSGRKRPMHVQLFTADGIVEYVSGDNGLVPLNEAPEAYTKTVVRDAAGVVSVDGAPAAAGVLPLVPFYANNDARSELTPAIKSKIDLYDRILSDFGDNLDKANDVYWVLNNFGGNIEEIAIMLGQIHELKAVANRSDGTGAGSTVEQKAFEVPHQARQAALDLLSKALYQDYMALSMDEMTGGSLTNVAIEAAMTNLNLKADRYEWQAFAFVQGILKLAGIETEEITFKRQSFVNKSEIVADIQLMREDIDDETALKLNPYIDQEWIEAILANKDAKALTGFTRAKSANQAREGGGDDGQGDGES